MSQIVALPHSEESERAVLAAALMDRGAVDRVTDRLLDEDFYQERHRSIFRAIGAAAGKGAVDLRTVQAELESEGRLDAAGGLAYLANLDLELPDLGGLDQYVEIVKERSVRRRLVELGNVVCRGALEPGSVVSEILQAADGRLRELAQEATRTRFASLNEAYSGVLEDLEDRDGGTGLIGLSTGFPNVDRVTRGLRPGNLVVVAGRPGMGKTTFAMNVAQHVSIRGRKTAAVFSIEMSTDELALRILSSESGVPAEHFALGYVSRAGWERAFEAVRRTSDAPLYLDDSPDANALELCARARRAAAEHGLALVVIDYLQLLTAGQRYENRTLEVAGITRGLKRLAKELGAPVMLLSQLSRQTERRGSDLRPRLSDLRESGAIEQDADLVMFLYREELYRPDEPSLAGVAEVIVAKHRNGPTGTVKLRFDGHTNTFRTLTTEEAAF